VTCGSCGAFGTSFPRLKSGLIRCPTCYVRIHESNRAALEDECGVCVWPRVAIEMPLPTLVTALPAPESQDTVTPYELGQRAQDRARRARWKNQPRTAVDVKSRQAAES
jgi:hypothetical protein